MHLNLNSLWIWCLYLNIISGCTYIMSLLCLYLWHREQGVLLGLGRCEVLSSSGVSNWKMWVAALGGRTRARNEWHLLGRPLRKESSPERGDSELSPMVLENCRGFCSWTLTGALYTWSTLRGAFRVSGQVKLRAIDKGVTHTHLRYSPSVTWGHGTGTPWLFLQFNIWGSHGG